MNGPLVRPLEIATVRRLYDAGGGGHDFDHVLRVLALAEHIARAEGADLEVVRTAALLHDIAESEDRAHHHILGAQRAVILLADWPAAIVNAVVHAIEAHRFRADPQPRTLEAQVLSDADKLDAIGAIGIARAFAYAGAHNTALWRTPWRAIAAELSATDIDAGAATSGPAQLGEAYTPVHEYVYKLDQIAGRLYTQSGRTIASERQVFMRIFFDRLDAEAQGEA